MQVILPEKKISVIIPMYNVAAFLKKCISSVYNQSLKQDDFEVILIDDCSPDNSSTIATEIIKNYKNARIITHTENKGLGGARNTGIINAKGEYLLFLDADDWYLPGMIPLLLQEAEQNTVDILEFGAQGINEKNKVVYTKSLSSNKVYNGIRYYQKYRYMDSACNKLYNRYFLTSNDIFFAERLYIEDYEFNTRAFYKAQKAMATKLIAGQFFQSPNSITRTLDTQKRLKMQTDIVNVIKQITNFYNQSNNESSRVSAYFHQRLNFLTATLFFQLWKNKSSYKDFVKLKNELINENIFFIDHFIYDLKKNLFRIILLQHFYLFKIVRYVN